MIWSMHKMKIIITMYSSSFRDELVHLLGHEGYEVFVCSDCYQTLQLIRKNKINAIVTQLNFPEFDGLELILNLRDLRINIPIIVISFEDTEVEDEIIQAGAHAFLHYPVEPLAVLDMIRHKMFTENEIKL
jgi:DNA-binding response OmpR family regulator